MQITSKTQRHESKKFHYQIAKYAFLIQNNFDQNAPRIKRATAHQSLVKMYRTKNGLSGKLDFSMPYCSILFTHSEYTTLFEMPSILSELQPITVW